MDLSLASTDRIPSWQGPDSGLPFGDARKIRSLWQIPPQTNRVEYDSP